MSSPDTNLDKQKSRHWGPLIGIAVALAAAVIAMVYFISADPVSNDAADPDGTPAAVEDAASDG
ncbi:MAG: hypothetical protein AAGL89_01560 [Pseudomonadota bacterium]